jgi:FkbM family methyltransferase
MPGVKAVIRSLINRLGYDVSNIRRGFHDPYLDQKSLLQGREVRMVFDVGANVGQTARVYRDLFPGALIHSFEPYEESYRALAEACRGCARLRPHQLAIADVTGSRPFFSDTRDSRWDTLVGEAGGVTGFTRPTEVRTTTLDDFCAAEGVREIQVLKMDIQGAELMALRGAVGLLGAQAIDLIYTEVLFTDSLGDQVARFDDLWRFLKGYGFRLYGLYNLAKEAGGWMAFGDAVFIGPRLKGSFGRR